MQETWGLLAPTPRVSMPIQSKASPTWFGRLSAAAAVARPDCRTAGIHEDDPLEVRALVEAATDREGDLLAVGCGVVERDLHVGALQTRQVLPGHGDHDSGAGVATLVALWAAGGFST